MQHTIYVALGVNLEGRKELLRLWLSETEGVWLSSSSTNFDFHVGILLGLFWRNVAADGRMKLDIYVNPCKYVYMGKGPLYFPFTASGLLPPGDTELTLRELLESTFVYGCEAAPAWDVAWRRKLVLNLTIMVNQLFQVGIENIFVNGSFVEDKGHPNDIDGYFECDLRYLASGELERDLNLLDPHKAWTWAPESRRPYRGYPKKQLPMWHVYRVELYPHYGQLSGIKDRFGHDLEFPSAFRQSRTDGEEKGVLKIVEDNHD